MIGLTENERQKLITCITAKERFNLSWLTLQENLLKTEDKRDQSSGDSTSCEEADDDDYESEVGPSDCDENWSPLEEMVELGNENEDLKANIIRYENDKILLFL